MTQPIFQRERQLALYMIETGATVRACASHFGISKSTVHKDIVQRLPKLDPELYIAARKVLDLNKQERHIRGGLATREKYRRQRQE